MKKRMFTPIVSKRNKTKLWLIFPLLLLIFSTNALLAQQVIGSFPTMDGGFEAETVGALTATSISGGGQTSTFTCEGNNGTGIQNTVARTGTKSVNLYYTGTSTKRLLQSPTAGAGLVTTQTYTVQYYYRTAGSTGTGAMMQVGANISGTGGTTPKYFPSSAPFTTLAATNGLWSKAAYTTIALTGTSSSSTYGIGIIRASATASIAMGVSIDVDDFVMYAGAVDNTAPDAPTSPSIPSPGATQMAVSWTAPTIGLGNGIDGGGYMVVRSTVSDPTAVPNPNGIYAVGNTVSDGVGVSGTVAYIGTSTSFNDTGLSPTTQYFYRIYSVDKAFNYSSPISVNATTIVPSYAAEPTVQAINVTFANVTQTGFDINWTAGNGANSLVVVKAGGLSTDNPADGNSYTPVTTFGTTGSQIGAGNYVVFSGAGNTVTVTGLSKAIRYYVKVYTYNGTSGTENYLITTPATGVQLAKPGEFISNGSNKGVLWNSATWTALNGTTGTTPSLYDNATIVTGDTLIINSTTASCYNLRIQPGAKFYIDNSSIQYHSFYGDSIICNGVLGDKMKSTPAVESAFGIQFFGNLTISGAGVIRPSKIRPGSGATNASVTFLSNVEVTSTASAIISDYGGGNDNITYIINPGVTLTVDGNWPMASSTGTNGTANTTINIFGTCSILKALATPMATGKICTVNVKSGGKLTTGTSCSPYSLASGEPAVYNVDGTFNTVDFNVTPTTAVFAPTINVGSTGTINITGNADFSNTTLFGTITGAGTVNLNSGATVKVSAGAGLDPTNGPIRTANRTFDPISNYSFVGAGPQFTGSDLPININNLTLANSTGLTLSKSTIVNGVLTLSSGKLSLGANNLGVVGSISGATSSNYIVTDGAGKLGQSITAGGTVVFPIGSATDSYDPVTLTPTDATNVAVNVGVNLPDVAPANFSYNTKVWDIYSETPSATLLAFTPTNPLATSVTDVIGHFVSGSYVNVPATRVANTYSATFSTFSPFVTGTSDLGTAVSNPAGSEIFITKINAKLVINGTSMGDVISVYNANGQLMSQLTAKRSQTTLNLPKGIYMVKINSEVKKVVL